VVVVEVRYQPNWERGAFRVLCIEGRDWSWGLSFCLRCLGGERNWGVFGRFWAFWGGDGGGVGVRYQIGGQYGANRVYLGRADEAILSPRCWIGLRIGAFLGFWCVLGRGWWRSRGKIPDRR
jgi:hypothetical protein